jgi:hypothetical protein
VIPRSHTHAERHGGRPSVYLLVPKPTASRQPRPKGGRGVRRSVIVPACEARQRLAHHRQTDARTRTAPASLEVRGGLPHRAAPLPVPARPCHRPGAGSTLETNERRRSSYGHGRAAGRVLQRPASGSPSLRRRADVATPKPPVPPSRQVALGEGGSPLTRLVRATELLQETMSSSPGERHT